LAKAPSGIHFGFLLANLGTLALLFLLARRWFEPAAVPVCCSAYVLLSLSPAVLGPEGHATNLVVLCALGGLLLLLRARPTGRPMLAVFKRAALWLGVFVQTTGLFFGIFAAAVLVPGTR
jgi:hypothetical protein